MTSIFLIGLFSGCSEEGGGDDPDPVPMPTISSIDPSSGVVGDEVTITGTNFGSTASENAVTFNGVTASVVTASATQLVVEVPENATTGPVVVTVGDQTVRGPDFTVIEANLFDCANNEITEDTTWEDLGDGVDYVIECEISVKENALLTIEPGVIIQFEGQLGGIFTSEGGGLKAVGTSSDPIQFLGTSDNPGTWKGIYFGSNHPENRLEHVVVKHAGRTASTQSGEIGAVQLSRDDESRAALVNVTIEDNEGYGLFVTDESVLSEFADNTISGNTQAPVGLYFNQLGSLDASSNYQDNDDNYIEVRENEIEDDEVTVPKVNVPYRFVESIRYDITQLLTISAGNTLEFVSGSGLRLGSPGTDCGVTTGALNATGTAEEPIVFRGINEGSGTWLGIGFNSSSPNNKLIYCEISGGGSSKFYNGGNFAANVTLQCESKVTIQNSTISESGGYGIYLLDEDAQLDQFTENTLTNNELSPVWLHFPQVDQLDAASVYAEGNGQMYIDVEGDDVVDADLTVKKLEVPYRMGPDGLGLKTRVGKVLTIEPGVTMEFETSAGIALGSPGTDCGVTSGVFNAVGTAEEPIILKGTAEGQGAWVGIGINSSSSENKLIYCTLSGGGSKQLYNAGGRGNLVIHCQGRAEVRNSTINDSGGWGIDFVQGGNSLTESDNVFDNNAEGNIAPN
ncbi:MAG: IPT/TIG domain-containing protein [Bacteroidota bacterium]